MSGPLGTLYHEDPEDCPMTEAAHRFEPSTGYCQGHDIPRTPSPCACHATADDACTAQARDPDEAPYCPPCHSARVLGLPGRDCAHVDP